jgi:hypothetical protein
MDFLNNLNLNGHKVKNSPDVELLKSVQIKKILDFSKNLELDVDYSQDFLDEFHNFSEENQNSGQNIDVDVVNSLIENQLNLALLDYLSKTNGGDITGNINMKSILDFKTQYLTLFNSSNDNFIPINSSNYDNPLDIFLSDYRHDISIPIVFNVNKIIFIKFIVKLFRFLIDLGVETSPEFYNSSWNYFSLEDLEQMSDTDLNQIKLASFNDFNSPSSSAKPNFKEHAHFILPLTVHNDDNILIETLKVVITSMSIDFDVDLISGFNIGITINTIFIDSNLTPLMTLTEGEIPFINWTQDDGEFGQTSFDTSTYTAETIFPIPLPTNGKLVNLENPKDLGDAVNLRTLLEYKQIITDSAFSKLIIPNTIYVDSKYEGRLKNGGIFTPFINILDAVEYWEENYGPSYPSLIYVRSGIYDNTERNTKILRIGINYHFELGAMILAKTSDLADPQSVSIFQFPNQTNGNGQVNNLTTKITGQGIFVTDYAVASFTSIDREYGTSTQNSFYNFVFELEALGVYQEYGIHNNGAVIQIESVYPNKLILNIGELGFTTLDGIYVKGWQIDMHFKIDKITFADSVESPKYAINIDNYSLATTIQSDLIIDITKIKELNLNYTGQKIFNIKSGCHKKINILIDELTVNFNTEGCAFLECDSGSPINIIGNKVNCIDNNYFAGSMENSFIWLYNTDFSVNNNIIHNINIKNFYSKQILKPINISGRFLYSPNVIVNIKGNFNTEFLVENMEVASGISLQNLKEINIDGKLFVDNIGLNISPGNTNTYPIVNIDNLILETSNNNGVCIYWDYTGIDLDVNVKGFYSYSIITTPHHKINLITDLDKFPMTGSKEGSLLTTNDVMAVDDKLYMTSEEKSKLSGLESSKYLGQYVSLIALTTAHPSPVQGSYAFVDAGVGENVKKYLWDSNDNKYVTQFGEGTEETPESVKIKYESNADTNVFSDAEKTKLGSVNLTLQHEINKDSKLAEGTASEISASTLKTLETVTIPNKLDKIQNNEFKFTDSKQRIFGVGSEGEPIPIESEVITPLYVEDTNVFPNILLSGNVNTTFETTLSIGGTHTLNQYVGNYLLITFSSLSQYNPLVVKCYKIIANTTTGILTLDENIHFSASNVLYQIVKPEIIDITKESTLRFFPMDNIVCYLPEITNEVDGNKLTLFRETIVSTNKKVFIVSNNLINKSFNKFEITGDNESYILAAHYSSLNHWDIISSKINLLVNSQILTPSNDLVIYPEASPMPILATSWQTSGLKNFMIETIEEVDSGIDYLEFTYLGAETQYINVNVQLLIRKIGANTIITTNIEKVSPNNDTEDILNSQETIMGPAEYHNISFNGLFEISYNQRFRVKLSSSVASALEVLSAKIRVLK